MSFHDMPSELTAIVLEYLAQQEPARWRQSIGFKAHISQYASTSFSVQCAVENHLFSRLLVESDESAVFEELVVRSSRRRSLLHSVAFTPILPGYDEVACSRFERSPGQQADDEALTTAMSTLYTALRDCNKLSSIRVEIPYSPTDTCDDRRTRYPDNRVDYMRGRKVDIWQRRYAQSLLSIQGSLDLPLLDRVTTSSMPGDYQRYVYPRSGLTLVRSHSRVETLALRLNDDERTRPELRKQLRSDFARDISITQCSALRQLILSYRYVDPSDQRFANADVRGMMMRD
jgi:hypothetical protein